MKKIIYLIMVSLFVSCSNTNNDTAEVEIQKTLVTRIAFTNQSGTGGESNFIYDGEKLVEKNENGFKYEYFYFDNKIERIEKYLGISLQYKTIYEYYATGSLSKEMNYDYANSMFEVKIFDSKVNYCDVKLYRNSFEQSPTHVENQLYLMENGEVVEIRRYNINNSYLGKTVYGYDTANSPYKNILSFNKQLSVTSVNNNLLSETVYNQNNELVSSVWNDYEYNSQKYPISCSRRINFTNGNTAVLNFQYQY